ncbi:MAG: sodium:calcium antiporter [Proteobacteria bacterium]|nr:sodium:calcium antiporter [Pseudomonadota bacterium]MBU1687534.1 sodium:calcium antiporter [Pseudomonadota bacterium]
MEYEPNFASLGLSFVALIAGLILLIGGGEALVSGASRFALRHGMRPMVVGLTVVAFGTSLPELFVSLVATFADHADIMIGNVIGSNIANIGLILGIAALIRPVPVHFAGIRKELFMVLGVSCLIALVVVGGYFYRWIGIALVAYLIWNTVQSCFGGGRFEVAELSDLPKVVGRESNFMIIGLQIAGLIMLAYGSNLFIDGAVDVARHVGISELVIGLTIAAVGTSLPELASSLSAIRRGHNEILIGNIIGSNLFNLMMVMGGTAALRPFALSSDLLYRDLPMMIGLMLFLLPLLIFRGQVSRLSGFMMLAAYGSYVWILVG